MDSPTKHDYEREITQDQYDDIKDFSENAKQQAESHSGRWADYEGPTNSCVDFTWGAISAGGLAGDAGGWQGNVLPGNNQSDIEKYFARQKSSFVERWDKAFQAISDAVRDFFHTAQTWRPRVDPLILDLDGDGLDTVGASSTSPILFDHDNDGIQTGTGWVNAEDGFLVFDRNGNGAIDNGSELFGDATDLYAGGKAADGFAALAQEDSNHDGKVDSQDAHWSQLRVWRDLNQDGVSQANELFGLDQLGIAGIHTAATANSQTLANGNQIADLGSFVRTDGSTGRMGDVALVEDTFARAFADHVALAEGVAALPDMQGAGRVRDLREAASLSPELKTVLAQYSQAATRQEQRTWLDQLLGDWADTSGLAKTLQERANGQYTIAYQAFGSQGRYITNSAGQTVQDPNWSAIVDAWEKKLHVLEAFNGRYFFKLPNETQTALSAAMGLSLVSGTGGNGALPQLNVTLSQDQVNLLNQSYDALSRSVYDDLLMQTRFKPLLDQIGLVIDDSGIRFDFSAVEQHFREEIARDAVNGVGDLIEFTRVSAGMLAGAGWQGNTLIESYIRTTAVTPELQSLYRELNVLLAGQANFTANGSAKDELFVAGNTNDTIYGNDGNDLIFGGAGNDYLYGGNGDDVLDGGAGNDYVMGDVGSDTYLFGKGDGQDTIYSTSDATAGKVDTLQFKAGVAASELSLSTSGTALVVKINGTSDQVTVQDFLYQDNPANAYNPLQQIRFADGTTWNLAEILNRLYAGTDNAETLSGTLNSDAINGLGGADYLYGKGGNDTLDGGAGTDTVYGGDGDDQVYGGADNDYLYGQTGNDTLDGGAGNDYVMGDVGSDTYLFGKGDGQDTIYSTNDATAGKVDTLQFKAGVAASDVSLSTSGTSLVVKINGTSDQVTVQDFLYQDNPANAYNPLQQIRFADGTTWNLAEILSRLYAGTNNAETLSGTFNADTINGQGGADYLYGKGGNDTLDGGAGTDTVYGGDGDDQVYGGADNDYLYGQTGNDTLDGGAGNDYVMGDVGSDTYLFGKGDGQDTIYSTNDATAGKVDTLQFKAGVAASDVSLSTSGTSLVVKINGTSDQVTVQDFLYQDNPANAYNPLQQIRFADGITWNLAEILNRLYAGTNNAETLSGTLNSDAINGLGGADYLYGKGGNDTLDGGAGTDTVYGGDGDDQVYGGADNDYLYGQTGNDTLDGGAGNDYVMGDVGSDTYLFGKGDGQDTIYSTNDATAGKVDTLQFKAGVAASDVSLSTSGTSLVVKINGTSDQVTVQDFLYQDNPANAYNPLQQIRFADGITWNLAEILNRLYAGTNNAETLSGTLNSDAINGLGGADYLYGKGGNDTLDGGAGTDTVYGGDGDDQVYGGADNDYLYGQTGNDTLDGGAGNDYVMGDVGSDTYLFGKGDGQDTIYSTNDATAGKVDTLQFKAGVAASDVSLSTSGTSLVVKINGTSDQVTVQDFLYQDNPANAYNPLQQIRFADGTTWNLAEIQARLYAGTDNAETLNGTLNADTINGQGGADYLYGKGGNDTLDGGAGTDTVYGGDGDDQVYGGDGNDYLYGEAGNDTFDGGAGDDHVYGGSGNDIIQGGDGSDVLSGEDGNDILDGGAGDDQVYSGNGADTFRFSKNQGKDFLYGQRSEDVLVLGDGIAPGDVTFERYYSNLDLVIRQNGVEVGRAVLVEQAIDYAATYTGVKQLQFADGTVWDAATIRAVALNGGGGNDSNLRGYNSDDVINGNGGNDYLYGESGNDILQGGQGTDTLNDTSGNNLFNGGMDSDTLTGGAGNEFFIGGAGNDSIITGAGYDVIAFNRGDGQDTVAASTGKDNTLSLGGGITYADLLFSKSGNDLVLATGASEQVLFKDWYANTNNHSVANLQIVIEGSGDYDPTSANQLNNRKVEQFNFDGLAGKFDQARAANPALTSWALSSSMLEFYLAGSDTAALGGDLAYQYAANGGLSAMSVTPAQALLGSPQFGSSNQNLQASPALQDLSPRLM